MNIYIIDNYGSFTYNLYQYIGELLSSKRDLGKICSFNIIVKRNDEVTLTDVENTNPDRIIISPGPGSPVNKSYFGICEMVIRKLGLTIPLLGVCLGMQGIVQAFGGNIVKAIAPIHGKTSPVCHTSEEIFKGLPNPIEVMRYHSLVVDNACLPSCFNITAVVSESFQNQEKTLSSYYEIMAINHKDYPIFGVQFHPESFWTECGQDILENFLFNLTLS
ncbi:MAG: aminodeoxychorismate/anthranilate synthase component II [Piscirickettsiaceae bacterium]|nr:aminodeoxychorismate/anthranilate synthase component II [Piscirickettsiaceae bacterium]